jgi:hypothetical protein
MLTSIATVCLSGTLEAKIDAVAQVLSVTVAEYL